MSYEYSHTENIHDAAGNYLTPLAGLLLTMSRQEQINSDSIAELQQLASQAPDTLSSDSDIRQLQSLISMIAGLPNISAQQISMLQTKVANLSEQYRQVDSE